MVCVNSLKYDNIGQVFFEKYWSYAVTVTNDCHFSVLEQILKELKELEDLDWEEQRFQPDGALSHTANITMA